MQAQRKESVEEKIDILNINIKHFLRHKTPQTKSEASYQPRKIFGMLAVNRLVIKMHKLLHSHKQ